MNEEKIIETVPEKQNEIKELMAEVTKDLTDSTEEPIKKGRKNSKNKIEKISPPIPSINASETPVKIKGEKSNILQKGDYVRITSYVGVFTDGTPVPSSLRYTPLYVNSVNTMNQTVELRNVSGRVVGSLPQSVLTKINTKK